jgi:NAD(P)-dependent dehydrogenase (short-subunit alcohol dehydrogenase family)
MGVEGRSVVVTGGAGGLGRYIARQYAEHGAHVAIGDRDDETLERTAAELGSRGRVVALGCDVTREEDVARLMDATAASFGTIDVLVNSAGTAPRSWSTYAWPPVRSMERAFWDGVLATNIHGAFYSAKHALRYMEPQRSGHIVTVAGPQGGAADPLAGPYVATAKAGLIFTRYLAEQEREFDICVMSIPPGGEFATERSPAPPGWAVPGPEIAGNRYLLAADAPMSLSGRLVAIADGALVPIDYNHEWEQMPMPTHGARAQRSA